MKGSLTKNEKAYLEVRDALSFKFEGDGTYRILSATEVLNESLHAGSRTLTSFIRFWISINREGLSPSHYACHVQSKEPEWK